MSSPEETLHAYVAAFASFDAAATASFYHLPCTFVSVRGVAVAPDAAHAQGIAAALIAQAKAGGYHHSEIRDLVVRTLDTDLATLAGVFVRFDAAGGEIGRFGFGYTMLRGEAGWKIVVALAHGVLD